MSDFALLYPQWLLALLPWLAVVWWLTKRQRKQTLIAPHLAKAMGIQSGPVTHRWLKGAAWLGAIAILALSGPSLTSKSRPSFANSSARVVVMDMSMSMYATDVKPNRLTQARYKVSDLLSYWQEGSTGLVAYAGDAYIVSPMTSDSSTIANLVPNLSPELMPYPGADAARGVELAISMMQNTGLATGDIVLVTDDIDNAELEDIKDLVGDTDWRLTILGVGSRAGAPIQLSEGKLMTTDNGQTVIAKSNFANMRELASSVGGQFVTIQLTNKDVERIAGLTNQIDSTDNNLKGEKLAERLNQGFWLLPVLILGALTMFRRGVLFALIIGSTPFLMPKPVMASPWLTNEQQAKQLFDAGDYQQAAELFEDPDWKGIAQYKAGDYKGAVQTLQAAEGVEGKYNYANALAQSGELEKAVQLYEQILQTAPEHKDAQTNLDVVKKALEKQQQQGQNSQQKGQPQNDAQDSSSLPDSDKAEKDDEEQNANQSKSEPSSAEPRQAQANKEHQNDDQQSALNEPQATQPDEQTQQPDSTEQPASAVQSNQQPIDPELRKLQQVESARDPSRLIRAQMVLQAKQKQPPQQTGKKW
ncbi:TPR domain protein in aerotolerance operon [Vibrio sinaloensis DSM 21326]|uniref:TPR domain protein in aerotolerance operon n=1 Tax=Vibrio sinaloensis DSM 21326 TaxID=945550 RepID=E8MBD9_PHOS4|nr:VWA domain-containing protein [Vibrio sinaloensis]EGA68722.1 TPR domain protein in aerotolerance operon [Vibrio sinaloensis DSM 21326]